MLIKICLPRQHEQEHANEPEDDADCHAGIARQPPSSSFETSSCFEISPVRNSTMAIAAGAHGLISRVRLFECLE